MISKGYIKIGYFGLLNKDRIIVSQFTLEEMTFIPPEIAND